MIVHVCPSDKFIPAFIDFVRSQTNNSDHRFFIQLDAEKRVDMPTGDDIVSLDSVTASLEMMNAMKHAEKIILHSLWVYDANRILLENLKWLKRCYWNMWGGDFYNPENQPSGTHTLIKNMGYCLTDVDGDYELARQWYDTQATHLRCMGYPSNVFSDSVVEREESDCLRILVGNSADPSNNHLGVLPRLAQFINQPVEIFAPLSYGDKTYAAQVCEWGETLLADQFKPMHEVLPLEKYQRFMESIDIAVFNHNRQQALGNIIPLIGMGKKVFMQSDTAHARRLSEQGISIFPIEKLSSERLSSDIATENNRQITHHYSADRLRSDWANVFAYSL